MYWWYSGTNGQPYAYNRKSLSAARFPQIGSILVLSVFLLMGHSKAYRLESVVSPVLMPTIYLERTLRSQLLAGVSTIVLRLPMASLAPYLV